MRKHPLIAFFVLAYLLTWWIYPLLKFSPLLGIFGLFGPAIAAIIADENGTDISKLRKTGPPRPPIVPPPGAPEVAGDVGVTSHAGDLLRRAGVPSRFA
jgi:hypothetical protein